jgi:hypothetical protein
MTGPQLARTRTGDGQGEAVLAEQRSAVVTHEVDLDADLSR